MTLQPSTKIVTVAGGMIRWSRVHHVEHGADRRGVIAYIAGQAVPLASNSPEVEAELLRLADERDRDAVARFGGPMEPWVGGTGREGVERALDELARRK